MMVKVKPLDVVVKKWKARASVATEDYKYGVQNPKQPWAAAAEAAFDAWAAGVQDAIADRRFIGGVRRAGDAKWARKALEVGAARYAPGITAASEDYEKAMGEVLKVIESVSLPARGPRGAATNYERVKLIGDTLHKWKLAKKKATA